jgi:DNA-binding beta-propeller fold protein YncE
MLRFSNDGRTLVATNRGSDTISVFELTATDPLSPGAWRQTTVSVCRAPEGIDISPDGREAWVGCRSSNEIGIVDLAQKKVLSTFPTNTKAVARVRFAPGGKRLLATDPNGGELVLFDVATHRELSRLKMGTACEGICLLPGGRRALIAVTNDDNVAEIDLVTMSIVRRFSTGEGPDGMAWIGE